MRLYTAEDVLSIEFIRLPKSLLKKSMSSDAKLAYALMFDRLSLSQRNGWVNADGAVFLILKREELAETLGISYSKATLVFKELSANDLIFEKRCGQGKANRIYIVNSETQKSGVLNRENRGSETIKSTDQEPQKSRMPYIKKTYINNANFSQSIDGDGDLADILENCQLEHFDVDARETFRDTIERMWYSERLRIGSAILPQESVRSRMRGLDCATLESALHNLRQNTANVKNISAYIITTIYNALVEDRSLMLVDGYINQLRKESG